MASAISTGIIPAVFIEEGVRISLARAADRALNAHDALVNARDALANAQVDLINARTIARADDDDDASAIRAATIAVAAARGIVTTNIDNARTHSRLVGERAAASYTALNDAFAAVRDTEAGFYEAERAFREANAEMKEILASFSCIPDLPDRPNTH